MSVTMRASLWFVFCGVLKDSIDLVVTPVFTRILTTEEYGLFSVYNSWYQIFRIIFTLNVFAEVFNVGLAKFSDKRDEYYSCTLSLTTILCVAATGVFLCLRSVLSGFLSIPSALVLVMLVQIMFFVPYNCWQRRERYEYRYKKLVLATLAYTILQPLLGILAIKTDLLGIDHGALRIVSAAVVQILFGIWIYISQFRKKPVFYNRDIWKFILRFCLPLVPHYLSQILLNQSDRIMIDYYEGKTSAAIYSVAHSAAFVVQVVMTNLNAAFVPWLYEKLKRNDTSDIKRVQKGLLLLGVVSAFALIIVAPECMKLLAPDSYYAGVWVIPPLTVSVFLIFECLLISNINLFYERTVFVFIVSLAGTVSNLLLNWLFISRFGFIAAGYTTLFSFLLMFGLHYVFLRITCSRAGIKCGAVFPMRFSIMLTCLLTVLSGLVLLLYDMAIYRYGLLLAILIAAFIRRKRIIALISSLKPKKTNAMSDNG